MAYDSEKAFLEKVENGLVEIVQANCSFLESQQRLLGAQSMMLAFLPEGDFTLSLAVCRLHNKYWQQNEAASDLLKELGERHP